MRLLPITIMVIINIGAVFRVEKSQIYSNTERKSDRDETRVLPIISILGQETEYDLSVKRAKKKKELIQGLLVCSTDTGL